MTLRWTGVGESLPEFSACLDHINADNCRTCVGCNCSASFEVMIVITLTI